jgi:hypothetical protein
MTDRGYVRVDEPDCTIYVAPYTEDGEPVVWYQHPGTFDTTRGTVDARAARALRQRGRSVTEAATPAWCDPYNPGVDAAPERRA